MLKLAKDFYITSYKSNSSYWLETSLDKEYEYVFRYKNYKVETSIQYKVIGHTKESNIAIVNFGYKVDIEKWSDKEQTFTFIEDLDDEDGKSTKKYFDSKKAREIVLRFIERTIKKYLKQKEPAIVIRGALSDVKVNLPRYKRLDRHFLEQNYIKKEFLAQTLNSLYKICINKEDDIDKYIWVYCKKEIFLEELRDVVQK